MRSFVPFFLAVASPVHAQVSFGPSEKISGQRGPALAVAAGDFDGDGIRDILVCEGGLEGFYVRPGVGGNAFAAPRLDDARFGVPEVVAAGDFDGDGDDDLAAVLATGDARALAVLSYSAGGVWATTSVAPSVAAADDLIASDLDGDGDLDLVMNSSGPGVYAYFNDGMTFTESLVVSVGAAEVADSDLDADGIEDILFLDEALGEWRLAVGAGAGAFAPPVSFLPPALRTWTNLRAADLDGDGDDDLMLSAPSSVTGGLGRLTWIESLGALQFAPARDVPLVEPVDFEDLVLHDFNGDGLADPAFSRTLQPLGEPNPVLRLNLGAFQFAPSVPLFSGYPMTLREAETAVRFFDATGDGALDAVPLGYSGAEPALFPGGVVGAGRWFPEYVPLLLEVGAVTQKVLLDQDGDGDLDVVALLDGLDQIAWFQNLGGMCFDREGVLLEGAAESDLLAAGDFDGDSRDDLLMLSSDGLQATLRSGQPVAGGAGTFSGPVTVASWSAGELTDAEAADLGADGDLDVVAVIQDASGSRLVTWANDGMGAVLVETTVAVLPGANELAVGDINGDGFPDAAVVSPLGSSLFLGDAAGSFAPAITVGAAGDAARSPFFMDADADGDLDFLALTAQNSLRWVESDFPTGAIPFRPFAPLLFPGYRTVQAGDANGDGLEDLIGAFPSGGSPPHIGVYLLDPNGTYSSRIGVPGNTAIVADPEWADFDGDGDPDLIYRATTRLFMSSGLSVPTTGSPWVPCTPAAVNSRDRRGELAAWGVPSVTSNDLRLVAYKLPPHQFGIFIGSASASSPVVQPGSVGGLCLSGSIGLYNGPGEVQSSGADGSFALQVDLATLPTSMGTVSATAGQAWFFQAWHRDVSSVSPTSNLTNALQIVFEP